MQEENSKQILIVEDELILSYTIKEMLKEFGYDFTIIANKLEEAQQIIEKQELSLAILDINLATGNEGLLLAKDCFLKKIPFIYLTSYTDHKTLSLALETTPEAYLVKPVNPTELYSAVSLVIRKSEKQHKELTFKDGVNIIKLRPNEITHLKSDGIYVEIHTNEKKYLYRSSLIGVLKKLPSTLFIQTHRSYAINYTFVEKVKSNLITIGPHEIPISRTFKGIIKEKLM